MNATGTNVGPGTSTANANGIEAATTAMRAILQTEFGSADVLRLEEIDRPTIGDHEVLVQVRAAGLDRGTWHYMAGRPYLFRLMGAGLR